MRSQIESVLLGVAVLSVGLIPAHLIISTTHVSAQPQAATQTSIPIGRAGQINPLELVKVNVINDAPMDLYTAISGGARIELLRQEKTTFDFDSTPINVFAYPMTGEASLKFNTTIEGNVVTVRITQISSDTPGDGAINIKLSGEVYVY